MKVKLAKDQEAARLMDEALTRYSQTLGPYLNEAREKGLDRAVAMIREATDKTWTEAEAFATAVLNELRKSYVQALSSGTFTGAVKDRVEQEYTAFKVDPATAWTDDPPIAFEIGAWDKRAIEFMGRTDKFFFSKFIDNETMAGPVKSFLREHYLENGEAMFNKTTPEAIDKFRDLFGDRLQELENHQISNIINHSVQRMRNWSAGEQMREAGIEYAEVVAIIDGRTSEICKHLNGKRIPVGSAMTALDTVVEMSPQQYLEHLKAIKPDEYFLEHSTDEMAADGRGLPPYHAGGCRTRLRAVIE
jgi:SPP1 gp7 family putative phage head morphogenesis protein